MRRFIILFLLAGCSRSSPDAPADLSRESGPASHQEIPEGTEGTGRWRIARVDAGLDEQQAQRMEELESVGYVAGSAPAPGVSDVTLHDSGAAFAGYNFYTSGHGSEAILTDMAGQVLHRWRYDFSVALPDHPITQAKDDKGFWRRAHLFANGDVIALHEGLGILKVDKDSNLLWAHTVRVHHDLEILDSGDILVLTRVPHIVPRVAPDVPILEDFVSMLGADGVEKGRISLLECYESAAPDHDWVAAGQAFWSRDWIEPLGLSQGDIFHTNSLRVLDGSRADILPSFAADNVLVSFRQLDTIAVVSLYEKRVVWSMTGPFALQHDPRMTPDGNILVFNNQHVPTRASSVQEIDPVTGRIVWEHVGSAEAPFYSRTCGASRVLPNGNVLITESDNGRAFEVTREHQYVWEFYNPARAGERGEYIATLFDLVRFPPDFDVSWASPEHD